MTPHGSNLLRNVFLVACGAGAGALAGGFVVANSPQRREVETRLTERIVELETRLATDVDSAEAEHTRRRRHVDALTAEAIPAARAVESGIDPETAGESDRPARDVDNPDGGDRRPTVSQEFVQSVRSAIDEIRREDSRAKQIQKLRAERAKYVHDLDRRLTNYQELLGLSDEQIETVRTTALAGMDDMLRARAAGVAGDELATMERARQRSIRDIVGGSTYRDMRKLLLDEEARPTVVSVAGQAGIDKHQRDSIERLLDQHIEELVDLDVRARTEDLSTEERRANRDKMDAANQAAWDRMRNEILDAEQRERVPKRLQ